MVNEFVILTDSSLRKTSTSEIQYILQDVFMLRIQYLAHKESRTQEDITPTLTGSLQ